MISQDYFFRRRQRPAQISFDFGLEPARKSPALLVALFRRSRRADSGNRARSHQTAIAPVPPVNTSQRHPGDRAQGIDADTSSCSAE